MNKITDADRKAEELAQQFHETYERLAPEYHYRTREASAVPWEDVPAQNKALMIAVAKEIIKEKRWTRCYGCGELKTDYFEPITTICKECVIRLLKKGGTLDAGN